ncbi:MAG: hypothetical protein HY693_00340 [Deltaproteobacteria bacterium]|nr:hypothetical protein [Deltaproteobacteria bacterium]
MAEKKETQKSRDITNPVKELTGLVKESYLNGFEFAVSLWEENIKSLNTQVDYLINAEKDYAKSLKEFYSNLPKEVNPFGNGNSKVLEDGVDRVVAFQKEYINAVRSLSDKVTRETRDLTHKNVEKAFSLFDDYLNTFRV